MVYDRGELLDRAAKAFDIVAAIGDHTSTSIH
jgi:hypothetical protein